MRIRDRTEELEREKRKIAWIRREGKDDEFYLKELRLLPTSNLCLVWGITYIPDAI